MSNYTSITILGGGIFGYLWGRNDGDTNKNNPEWTSETYLLAKFENNLDSSNITGLSEMPSTYALYRTEKDKPMKKISVGSVNITEFNDYLVSKGSSYEYQICFLTHAQSSDLIVSLPVESKYSGHFLIDIKNKSAFRFDTNIVTSELVLQEALSQHQTLAKYDVFSRGIKHFYSGGFRGILWDRNRARPAEISQSKEIINSLVEFISSKRTVVYKDKKGNLYNVVITGLTQSQLNDNIKSQIVVCGVDFVEVGEINELYPIEP